MDMLLGLIGCPLFLIYHFHYLKSGHFIKFPICSDSIESFVPENMKLRSMANGIVDKYKIQGEGKHDALWDARVQGFYFIELSEFDKSKTHV